MSDYRRGKSMACMWATHWDLVADQADRGRTVEAELMEYHQSIRVAFTTANVPDIIATAMPPFIRKAHRHIMDLPADQRESLVVWHFGDESERMAKFNASGKEPNEVGGIYRKLGRKFRS